MTLKDIKKGEIFYESQSGMDYKCEALEDAQRVQEEKKDGHILKVRILQFASFGKLHVAPSDTEFFECLEPGGYGLRLYKEPQYHNPKIFS